MSGFTEGDWAAVEYYVTHESVTGTIHHPSHHVVADGDEVVCDLIENLDDVHLISASKEMYHALKGLLEAHRHVYGLDEAWDSELKAAEKALTKADGE